VSPFTAPTRHPEVERDRLFEGSRDIMVIRELNGTIVRANSSFGRILGLGSAEVFSGAVGRLVHPDDAAQDHGGLTRLREDGGSQSWETGSRTRTDPIGIWNGRRPPISISGGCYFVGRDVTERHEIDELLRESERSLRRRIAELVALRTIDIAIAGSMDLPHVLGVVLNEVGKVPDVEWTACTCSNRTEQLRTT